MQLECETNLSDSRPVHLYEYAVVRYVPDIERAEFVNIGLVMMCKRRRWLRSKFRINSHRILALFPETDLELLQRQISGFELVATGDRKLGSAIAELDAHERFRWLTAVRSAGLQTSRPHAGHTSDLELTFNNLFQTLV